MVEQFVPIHPIALWFTMLAGILIFLLPRRAATLPLLLAIVFLPIHQRFLLATLDFFIIRILVIFGWARVLARSEYASFRFNVLDKLMLLWTASSVIMYTLLWQTSGAFINRLGVSFDIIGVYFLARFLVRDTGDMIWMIKALTAICVPLALFMLIERATGRNFFSIFGGVPELTPIRDGKLRCQGAFSHPITAGTFGAIMLPLAYSLKSFGKGRTLMAAGIISATIIMACSSSSGPALAYLGGIGALYMWRFRHRMRLIISLAAASIVALDIAMKAPVWAIMMKIKIFGSSAAYHRYHLLDQFINRFNEWWLMGVKSTSHWGYFLFDVTNQFIRVAVDGGLVTLALFISVLLYAFYSVWLIVKSKDNGMRAQKAVWAIGAALFVHIIAFMGVSYFDQIKAILYIHLAMIAALGSMQVNEAFEEGETRSWSTFHS